MSTTISVDLPEPMQGFVDEMVRLGAFADAADYLRDLVKRDCDARTSERLQVLVQEGLDSGPASPLTEAEIADIRARIASVGR